MANFFVRWNENINLATSPTLSGSTFYLVANNDGTFTTLLGTGFTFGAGGLLTNGTITGAILGAPTGEALQTLSNLQINAADLFSDVALVEDIKADLTALDAGFLDIVPDPTPDFDPGGTFVRLPLLDGRFIEIVGTGLTVVDDQPVGAVTAIRLIGTDTTTIEQTYSISITLFEAAAVVDPTQAPHLYYQLLNAGANTLLSVNAGQINSDFYNITLVDSLGSDVLVGSPGNGVVDFMDSAGGPILYLASANVVFHANGDIDTLVNINYIFGTVGNDVLDGRGATAGITLDGQDGDDRILGSAFNDFLQPAAGADFVDGGAGIDTLSFSQYDGSNVIVNLTLNSALALGAKTILNIENVIGTEFGDTFTGSSGDNRLEGGAGGDSIFGNAGNDYIDGGAGIDVMYGGEGDDIFIVDNALDSVGEALNQGADEVRTSVTYTLTAGAYVERLVAVAGAGGINLTGNELDNTLVGNEGANVLTGGLGNDIYVIDSLADTIVESLNAGVDAVQASITYSIAAIANVETLTLTGVAAINGTGNALNNVIVGNTASNTLIGGDGNDVIFGNTGADTMAGGNGDDIFFVENAGDVVLDPTGTDTVVVNGLTTYTLGATIERLTMGVGVVTGIGNTLNNTIIGNGVNNTINGGDGADTLDGGGGDDTLNGGLGADFMSGGFGNDTFVVDNANDVTIEAANGGVDTVQSSVTRALAAQLENLTLTGAAAINGTGNGQSNTIIGNTAANVLNGLHGNDTLTGGTGADTFVFNTALNASTNRDTITDFAVVDDTIHLENAVFTALAATGVLNAGFLRIGAAAADANDFIIYNNATGGLFYDADGNGVGAAVQFATLTAGLALTNADFIVI